MHTRTLFVLVVFVATLGAQGTITSLSPASIGAGGPAFTLTVHGSGFASGNIVRWDTTSLSTTFVSANQLTAAVTAALITSAGSHTIRVKENVFSTNFSNVVTFNIDNAVPTISAVSPASTPVGSGQITVDFIGTGYVPASIARIGGVDLATTLVSTTHIQGVIPASMTTAAAPFSAQIFNPTPGGGTVTFGSPFLVLNPLPTMGSLSPLSVTAGIAGVTLSLTGVNFNSSSVVQFEGSALPTTFVDPTHVTAQVSAAQIAVGGSHTITVNNPTPGGGTTAGEVLHVNNPVPTMASISPGSVAAGSTSFTLTATGTNYDAVSAILFDGLPLTTTFIDSTHVSAAIAAALITVGATHAVTVSNPTPGGGTSGSQNLIVTNPVPTIGAINPGIAFAGTPGLTLTVTGTNYNASSAITFDAAPLTTTFIDSTHLSTTIAAALVANAANHVIRVNNPLPGGGSSGAIVLFVENPVPVITSLSPVSIPGGGPGASLTMAGAQFLPSTTVDASGTPIAASFVSSSQLNLAFPASLQRAIGTFTITVTNPSPAGGSASTPFTVDGPAISSCAPAVVPVMTGASPPITLTVNGGAFQAGDVLRINGAAQPTTLVDAQTLHCTLDGSFPVLLQPGGFAVTVTRLHLGALPSVSSNAFGVPVGIAGTPDNAGTVTLAPAPPAPGQAFNLRVELPVASGPVTLLAEVPAPPTVLLGVAPGFDLVVGPGLNSPIVLTDGLGIFGPVTPTFVAPYDLSSFGIPAGHGLFQIRNISAPVVPLGITFSLAAVYVDPASPIGVNATHVGGPFSL